MELAEKKLAALVRVEQVQVGRAPSLPLVSFAPHEVQLLKTQLTKQLKLQVFS